METSLTLWIVRPMSTETRQIFNNNALDEEMSMSCQQMYRDSHLIKGSTTSEGIRTNTIRPLPQSILSSTFLSPTTPSNSSRIRQTFRPLPMSWIITDTKRSVTKMKMKMKTTKINTHEKRSIKHLVLLVGWLLVCHHFCYPIFCIWIDINVYHCYGCAPRLWQPFPIA